MPEHIQRLADKNFLRWKSNPWHPSLRFKPLKGKLWSARVGDRYRAFAIVEDYTTTWIWIGTHETYNRLGWPPAVDRG